MTTSPAVWYISRLLSGSGHFSMAVKCVEAIPNVVNEIRTRIEDSAHRAASDVQIVEIGGTLGDYQNTLFLETARQMHLDMPADVMFILVSYLPCPKSLGEIKDTSHTKRCAYVKFIRH